MGSCTLIRCIVCEHAYIKSEHVFTYHNNEPYCENCTADKLAFDTDEDFRRNNQ